MFCSDNVFTVTWVIHIRKKKKQTENIWPAKLYNLNVCLQNHQKWKGLATCFYKFYYITDTTGNKRTTVYTISRESTARSSLAFQIIKTQAENFSLNSNSLMFLTTPVCIFMALTSR